MNIRRLRRSAYTLLLLVAVLLSPAFLLPRAAAQSSESVRSAPATQSPRSSASSSQQPEGDSDDAYRHSSSVQWVARTLHLNVETTAKIFEDLNSGILILAIAFFLVKWLPKLFRNHRKTIQTGLVDARTATEQANQRVSVVEARLSRLDTEIEAIRQQAERDGVQDEIRIKQALEDERRRIVESAEHEIQSAGVAAQRRLKQFAAELAIDRATRELHLTPEDDRLLVSDFGRQLNANAGKGAPN